MSQPDRLPLTERRISLWWARAHMDRDRQREFEVLLDPTELKRAQRFQSDAPRRRFIASRAILRQVLSAHTGDPAAELSFAYGPHGKPELIDSACDRLAFNVSHSNDLVAIAIARTSELGVDIECRREVPQALALARRFFTTNEWSWIESQPAEIHSLAFLHCWTSKEAYVKARGASMAQALRRVEISPDPSRPPRLVRIEDREHLDDWSLLSVPGLPSCLGVVAVHGSEWELAPREFRT